jgi:hypothetical protein
MKRLVVFGNAMDDYGSASGILVGHTRRGRGGVTSRTSGMVSRPWMNCVYHLNAAMVRLHQCHCYLGESATNQRIQRKKTVETPKLHLKANLFILWVWDSRPAR